ncbi:uncharacterized protein RHOBADRAFT_54681 [Rhodotorula graminis WP1]|uniref:Uncharacterized protein n=1 Tax=Rhodotorula graminis (strain WP1) TaxID=578459 RepID=A0A0P9FEB3_RHOGW|nr:uncharacterized protein RHOBADRAFT_54681 [Rhodotorula graminis WP1]KPV74123.1 hypothetical protein RHOBADRAFT_54681 [Rhodotorula graminis WP1]
MPRAAGGVNRPPNTAPLTFLDSPDSGLLFQLRAVYGWLERHDGSRKLSLPELEARWGDFLPSERAHFIRIALHVYCTRTDFPMLQYPTIAHLVGFDDEPTEAELEDREAGELEPSAWTRLMGSLASVRSVCPDARAARTAFGHWEHRFFASNLGITRRKLYRMSSAMHERVFERLAAAANQLAHASHLNTLPLTLLPTADTTLAYAFNAEQKPSQRFSLYLGLVENLYALYKADYLPVDAETHSDIDLETARDTVLQVDLKVREGDADRFLLAVALQNLRKHEARHAEALKPLVRALGQLTAPDKEVSATSFKGLVLFAHLSAGDQVSAVNTARGLVFEACKMDAEGEMLLDSRIMVAKLSTAVRGACFDAEGNASQTHHLDAHSLSHSARHARISPHYAERYYGTTAQRWEAERGGAAA